jgi:hypothetical protein
MDSDLANYLFNFMLPGLLKNCFLFIYLIIPLCGQSQLDSLGYVQGMEYLERKLTYTYYNVDQQMWWVNTFKYNADNGTVRFKSISSDNPAKLLGKKYTERVFRFSDLNPYKVTVQKIEENQGMIVKGSLIRIETVKHEKLVGKTINNRPASAQSYIHFSIPTYLEDSLSEYTETLLTTIQDLISYSTDLHNLEDDSENRSLLFEILEGEHVYLEGEAQVKRFTELQGPQLLKYEEYKDRHLVATGEFGFDTERDMVYEKFNPENGEQSVFYYQIMDVNQPLTFVDEENNRRIELINKSLFQYQFEGEILEYRPSRSF